MERALLEMLGKHSSIALAVCDAEGHLTVNSPALERILGYRADELTERDFDSLPLHDAVSQRALDPDAMPLARARHGETVTDEVVALHRAHDRTLYLRCSATPLRDQSHAIIGAIALLQDVTSEWVMMLKQAELRDQLVTTVSHELRTPLTKILGHSELLSEAAAAGKIAAPFDRSVDAIARASRDLVAMAEKLTHLANLDAATQVHPAPTDVVPVLRAAADSQRVLAEARHVEIDLSGPRELSATIDHALVERATRELLVNAVSHAPTGSRVEVGLTCADGYFEICVADHGQGVAPEDRVRVVQPFERGPAAPGEVSSMGLGLAVASAIAAAHGGTIRLEDNQPTGLVARMSLRRHVA